MTKNRLVAGLAGLAVAVVVVVVASTSVASYFNMNQALTSRADLDTELGLVFISLPVCSRSCKMSVTGSCYAYIYLRRQFYGNGDSLSSDTTAYTLTEKVVTDGKP